MDTKKDKRFSEEAKIRLEKARLKGLETRRMKAELKKVEKNAEKEALKKAYEEKVLKKKPAEPIEETDKEIYPSKRNNKPTTESDDDGESEYEDDEPVVVPKPKQKAKAKTKLNAEVVEQPNYKQEYYRAKLEKIRQQDEQQHFSHTYARLPPQAHMADIARNQLKAKVDNEVMARVYKDLFG